MPKFDSNGKLLRRKTTNFFVKKSISDTNFSSSKTSWDFISQGIALMVQSHDPTDIIQYSFDGETVHGDLVPTYPSAAIVFDERRQNTIWFRRESAGDPVLVRIEAWRNDY